MVARGTVLSTVEDNQARQGDESLPMRERTRQDLHGLNEDGTLFCNPRDREAAHRAQVEGIATDDVNAVTCRKCRALMLRLRSRGDAP